MSSTIPFRQRISCTIDQALEATGIGKTRLYEEIAAGRVHTRKSGARTLITVDSLLAVFGTPPDKPPSAPAAAASHAPAEFADAAAA